MAKTPNDDDDPIFAIGNNSGPRLLSYIERIEALNEEKAGLTADIKEIKDEAKGVGYDVKIITYLIKRRKIDKDDLAEFDEMVNTYQRAIDEAEKRK